MDCCAAAPRAHASKTANTAACNAALLNFSFMKHKPSYLKSRSASFERKGSGLAPAPRQSIGSAYFKPKTTRIPSSLGMLLKTPPKFAA